MPGPRPQTERIIIVGENYYRENYEAELDHTASSSPPRCIAFKQRRRRLKVASPIKRPLLEVSDMVHESPSFTWVASQTLAPILEIIVTVMALARHLGPREFCHLSKTCKGVAPLLPWADLAASLDLPGASAISSPRQMALWLAEHMLEFYSPTAFGAELTHHRTRAMLRLGSQPSEYRVAAVNTAVAFRSDLARCLSWSVRVHDLPYLCLLYTSPSPRDS